MVRRPLLVASIPIESPQDLSIVHSVSDTDFIELRVDYLEDPLAIDYPSLPKNTIVTLREIDEGGVRYHDSSVKLKLIDVLSRIGLMYDVELNFVKKYNIEYRSKIVSIHIMKPDKTDLKAVKRDVEFYMDKAFVVKIATKPFPGYKVFLAELLELGDNIAVMPIGTSYYERIAFALLGSKLLYCYIDKPTAPGQPRCDKVKLVLSMLSSDVSDDEPPPKLSR